MSCLLGILSSLNPSQDCPLHFRFCVLSETCFAKVDLIFAVDLTACDGQDWEDCAALGSLKRYMINVVQSLSITDEDFHVGVVIYGRSTRDAVTLASISRSDLIDEILDIDYSGSFRLDRRYTQDALADVQNMFEDEGRDGATRFCILITNGVSYRDAGTAADYPDINIIIHGVGVDALSDGSAEVDAVEEFGQLAYDLDSIYYPIDNADLIINHEQVTYDAICVEEGKYRF